MMGRVTFQDSAVVERVSSRFVATWANARPGYRVGKIDAATFEKFSGQEASDHDGDFAPDLAATLPNGQANENVATLVANARGELLHVVSGFWHTREFLAELAFAEEVAQAVDAAGEDVEARNEAAVRIHRERLTALDELGAGDLGRAVLETAHIKLAEEPLRDVASVEGVTEFAFQPEPILKPKIERLQRAVAEAQRDGRDLSRVGEAMKDFESLVKRMRVREAEETLDRALEAVEKE